jgi:hypothetical protein
MFGFVKMVTIIVRNVVTPVISAATFRNDEIEETLDLAGIATLYRMLRNRIGGQTSIPSYF